MWSMFLAGAMMVCCVFNLLHGNYWLMAFCAICLVMNLVVAYA